MTDLNILLRQITLRYRRVLTIRTLLLFALGLCLLWVLSWRLRILGFKSAWMFLGLACIALIGGVGLVFWLRRHWVSSKDTARRLDHELELQQRLITAVEFSTAKEKQALYSLLVEDAANRCSLPRGSF